MCCCQLICKIFVGKVVRVPVSKMVFDRKCIWLLIRTFRSVLTTVLYENQIRFIICSIIFDTLITLPRTTTNLQIN